MIEEENSILIPGLSDQYLLHFTNIVKSMFQRPLSVIAIKVSMYYVCARTCLRVLHYSRNQMQKVTWT